MNHKIALISVYNKEGIISLSNKLISDGYRILSTGGTYNLLKSNIESENIEKISDYTKFPEVFGGRVKSLHPLIYSGILSDDKNNTSKDLETIMEINSTFNLIDYVIVNLYPFEKVVSKQECSLDDAIENIDIGGVSLIRAPAKNYNRVTVLTDPSDYHIIENNIIENNIIENNLNTTLEQRKILATKAFHNITLYDISISSYFSRQFEKNHSLYRSYKIHTKLKYGCNPHQCGALLSSNDKMDNINELPFNIINGTPGYINIIDAIRAWELVCEINSVTGKIAATSFKHTTPAGVSIVGSIDSITEKCFGVTNKSSDVARAFAKSRDCDPLSSFGDFIAISAIVDKETALLIKKEVTDGIIALGYEEEALEILKQKKGGKYIILQTNRIMHSEGVEIHDLCNGVSLYQEKNNAITDDTFFENVPTNKKILNGNKKTDLILANIALKYTPSNSVAIALNGSVIGIGAGQQNRVDCVKLASRKAINWISRRDPIISSIQFNKDVKRQDRINAQVKIALDISSIENMNKYEKLSIQNMIQDDINKINRTTFKDEYLNECDGISLASDAFFPFTDNIDICADIGVKYIIQPGGSVADESVINSCNKYGILMAMSGKRMFLH